ncbi:putative beta-arrestin-1 isoform X2 [Penaeus vannamei]|uniref:Putative beta-arrestin-1 isoform X2 n=1 Tax=Penaeus vannamei TaxID=6689 RepID=A0A3R7MKS0_PENVA|nr:putative beta-arrestin-1 isoform X2 [Penaeus vannamei]
MASTSGEGDVQGHNLVVKTGRNPSEWKKNTAKRKRNININAFEVVLRLPQSESFCLRQITVYLAKRDYIDHATHVDPIEGVLSLDPNYVQSRNVYVQIVLQFRFGREDDESMGYSFLKTLYIGNTRVYPPVSEITPTEIQRNLMAKLGNFAFAFSIDFPTLASPSYTLQQGWEDMGALMGIEYELMAYVGANESDIHKRSTSRLAVRRLVECPKALYQMAPPRSSLSKTFFTCSGALCIRAGLPAPVFRPDDEVPVSIVIRNQTSREVKRVKVKLVQQAQVPMFSLKEVKEQTLIKTDEPIALAPGASLERTFTLMVTAPARQKHGEVFLQTKKTAEDPDVLAPSTILNPSVDIADIFGIHVNYVVRVKAVFGALTGDAVLDLPFTLAIER